MRTIGQTYGKHIYDNLKEIIPHNVGGKRPYGEPIMLPVSIDPDSPLKTSQSITYSP
jgi:hypothetical protein